MTRNTRHNPEAEDRTPGERLIDGLKEVLAHTRGEITLPTRVYEPPPVDVAAVRKRFGLSARKFAERFGLDPRALQEWEQGRRKPDRAARLLIQVIAAAPETVERVVRETADAA